MGNTKPSPKIWATPNQVPRYGQHQTKSQDVGNTKTKALDEGKTSPQIKTMDVKMTSKPEDDIEAPLQQKQNKSSDQSYGCEADIKA